MAVLLEADFKLTPVAQCADIIANFLSNDPAYVANTLRSGDILTGGVPTQIFPSANYNLEDFKFIIKETLIRFGEILAKSGWVVGDVSNINDIVNGIVQRYVDPALGLTPFTTGGLSHVDFADVGGVKYIQVKVNQI